MLFRCPNSGVINTAYIEFVSPVQYVEPNEENNLESPKYVFFVRTMSGFTVGFDEDMEEITNNIRQDLINSMS
jgi:hypothetical protein